MIVSVSLGGVPPPADLSSSTASDTPGDFDATGKERVARPRVRFGFPSFLTRRLIPDTELEERLAARAMVALGLRAALTVEVDELATAAGLPVSGAVEAGVDSGFVWRWSYRLLKAKILASGQNSSFADWELRQSPTLMGRLDLAVLCAPKGSATLPLEVTGTCDLHRGIAWWRRATPMLLDAPTPLAVPLPHP